jgi:predicted nucleic acid-binding protein
MPDIHCLLDTSALLKRYIPEAGSALVDKLFERNDVAVHIINMTSAEVCAAFLRYQLKGKYQPHEIKQFWETFKRERDAKIIIHHIHAGNMGAIKNIFDTSIAVPQPTYIDEEGVKQYKSRIGPIDVLVLAAHQELKKYYGSKVYLVCADEHMVEVAKKLTNNIFNPSVAKNLPF